jgi:hypothetical protein
VRALLPMRRRIDKHGLYSSNALACARHGTRPCRLQAFSQSHGADREVGNPPEDGALQPRGARKVKCRGKPRGVLSRRA